jgi:hypothetical protein
MTKKNRFEIIEELASNVEVAFKPYGTWIVKSKALGVPASFLTHDEEWRTGKYNPTLYNKENVLLNKEVENDYANEDNYESREVRDRRAAEALFAILVDCEIVEEDEEGNFFIA